jgi:TonB-dependent starch-binding outer membrane protein SusC
MKKNLTICWWGRLTAVRHVGLLLCILFAFQLSGVTGNGNTTLQDEKKTITGTITDGATGEALPGVSVLVKGTTNGTVSDLDGHFSIIASGTDMLVFNLIGYLEEEVTVGDQTVIDISLAVDLIGLDEVVVIGYGVQKKKLVTGATTQVKSEDLVNSRATRLETSLQGLTPGMVIVKQSGQPGSDFNITIRGLGSVNGSTPLVLVDGVPSSLNTLNPNDVESIDVLKDAASAAIYGSRAADGVILVTTKKGKAGEPKLTYDFYYGWGNVPKKVSLLNATEYTTIMNEFQSNMFPTRPPIYSQELVDTIGTGTDWLGAAIRKNAPMQNHYLGITGGNEKSTYSVSLSYTKEDGIMDYKDKSYYERMGFRINSDHQIKKYLRIGQNLTYTHRKQSGLATGNLYNNFLKSLFMMNPVIPIYDTNYWDGFARNFVDEKQSNPIADMYYKFNEIKRYDDIVGDVYAEFEPIKGLKLRTDFGGTLNFTNNSTITDTFNITSDDQNPVPDILQYMERKFGYNWDNIISYENTFGKHSILLMAGTNAQDNWYFNMDVNCNGFLSNPNLDPVPSNIVMRPDLAEDTIIYKGDMGKGVSRSSVFGRFSYNYDEMILATATIRRDGSSRFGANYRYGTFPAFSLGYVMTKSAFMSSISWLDFLKIRGSWGQNGKEPNLDYRYMATVASSSRQYGFGEGHLPGISPNIIPNPNLRWEASRSLDFGLDARFLRDFNFAFDYYKETSKDWIVTITPPGISGIAGISTTPPYTNAGNVINHGVEFELGYHKRIGELSLDVNGNLAYNKNKVTNVPGGLIEGQGSVLYNGSDRFYRVEEGYPIGYFYGYITDGIFQTQEEIDGYVNDSLQLYQASAEPGDVKRVDRNNDGIINDNDKTMIGDPNPDVIYGLNLNMAYRGWDFNVSISGQAGNQIVKSYRAEERAYGNYTTDILDRWTGPGTSNRIPRITGGYDRNNNWRDFSDLYIENAGFMKVKSISLGYDLKEAIKKMPFEQFRVYLSATNLWTITNYTGMDPEVGYGSFYNDQGLLTDAYASGIDIGFYPAARNYLVGINVKF